MKTKKRIKQGSAAALALVLAVPAVTYQNVQAAVGIDTDRSCSVEFQVDGTFEELRTLDISVDLYKVAEVDSTGDYRVLEGFQGLGLDEIDSETTAQEWEQMAAQAADLIRDQETAPVKTAMLEDGAGIAEDLDTGMYLVEAGQAESAEYTYSFTPYLLSLPNNYYSASGNDGWVYDVTTGLKPEQEARYGSIQISKTLDIYQATLGEATFIFSVEAVKPDGQGGTENVYSDVVSLVFDGPGTRSVEVGNLPAGAQVTVTEVYSGASYELTTAASQTLTVTADGEEGNPAAVSFANTYNGENNGGASVVNHFGYTAPENEAVAQMEEAAGAAQQAGTWRWTQHRDSTDMQDAAEE